jgi:hypothetical protein
VEALDQENTSLANLPGTKGEINQVAAILEE